MMKMLDQHGFQIGPGLSPSMCEAPDEDLMDDECNECKGHCYQGMKKCNRTVSEGRYEMVDLFKKDWSDHPDFGECEKCKNLSGIRCQKEGCDPDHKRHSQWEPKSSSLE